MPSSLPDLAALFGAGGPLAKALPSFEPRPQQARMAEEVGAALASGRHLLIEAGTGIGKSIAYLLPAVLWAMRRGTEESRRVVVSTHTRALQEQLARKDLPLLQRVLEPAGLRFRYALLMGGENYLCVQRLEEAGVGKGALLPGAASGTITRLAAHARNAVSGLRSEVPFDVPDALWDRVRRDRDICLGARGPFWEDCLYRRDLARAREADILIVNHALFFLDLKTGGRILPPHEVVILDEGHRVEESVVSQMGSSVSDRTVGRLLEDLGGGPGTGPGRRAATRASSRPAPAPSGLPFELLARLETAARDFFEEVRRRGPALQRVTGVAARDTPTLLVRVRDAGVFTDLLREPLREIETALLERAQAAESPEAPALLSLGTRARDLREHLSAFVEQRISDSVYWIECGERRRAALHTAPIEVADVLRRRLFGGGRCVVLTSATLTTAGSFAHVRQRLGAAGAAEVVLGSPYDYEKQALLYLPPAMPDPVSDPENFAAGVVETTRRLLRASDGGAFVLFTSYALLGRVHSALAADRSLGGVELLRQEPGVASPILERFRMTRRGALLGTMTFWQGVDVPGDALRLVIITRLPFDAPGHPIAEARAEAIRARGGDPFEEDTLPEAILTFRQGFGRLIRGREDRGVVAILDPRLRTRPYGASFLESLPPCGRTESVEAAERFLKSSN